MAIFEALKKGSFSRNVLEDYEVRTTRTVLVEKNLKCVYLASLDIHVHAEDIFAILVKFFLGNTPVPAYYTFTVYKLSIKLSAISAKGEIVDVTFFCDVMFLFLYIVYIRSLFLYVM